jgi:hypothetical protein
VERVSTLVSIFRKFVRVMFAIFGRGTHLTVIKSISGLKTRSREDEERETFGYRSVCHP